MVRSGRWSFIADVFAIVAPFAIMIALAATTVDVPFGDEWEWVDLIYNFHNGTLHLGDVWQQHNEHRIFFPQLLMLALDWLGGWSQLREELFSVVVLAAGELALLWTLRKASRGLVCAVASIAGVAILYGVWQYENFTWGFQTAWFVCTSAALAVAAILSRPHRTSGQVIAAIIIAIIASYSSSQGLAVWAVGAVAIVCAPRRVIATLFVWLVAAGGTFALFEKGLFHLSAGHISFTAEPVLAAKFVLDYIGAPFAIDAPHSVLLSTLLAVIGFVVLTASVVADFVRKGRLRHFVRRAPFYALTAFPILSAIATAKGRAGYGVGQPFASRYTTVSDLLWLALVGIGATYLTRRSVPGRRLIAIAAIGAVGITTLIVSADVRGWHAWKLREMEYATLRTGLEHGDAKILVRLYPDPVKVRRLLSELQTIHDGLYAP